jgi:hypothetical protein
LGCLPEVGYGTFLNATTARPLCLVNDFKKIKDKPIFNLWHC